MQSIRALLNRIVDYAGLFPPAKLDMATTVRNYARYLESDDSWMLGRLIVPVARLTEFEEQATSYFPEADAQIMPWQISALTAPAVADGLENDIRRIEAFNRRHENDEQAHIIDAVELKADSPAAIDRAMNLLPDWLFPFFELPIERDPRGLIAALANGDAGAKVRTGGAGAEAYPTPADLARFIATCAAADVPFKATAGLHHPLRHFSTEVKAQEFGFLNVFFAACLAHRQQSSENQLIEVLEDESPSAFRFDDGRVGWKNHCLEVSEVETVREEFAISFGSCSFEEPLEDLRAMELL